jgi:hypothetical protein
MRLFILLLTDKEARWFQWSPMEWPTAATGEVDTTSVRYRRLWFWREDSDDEWDVPKYSRFRYSSIHEEVFQVWIIAKMAECRLRYSSCRYPWLDWRKDVPRSINKGDSVLHYTVRGIPSLLPSECETQVLAKTGELSFFDKSALKSLLAEAGVSLDDVETKFAERGDCLRSGTAYALEMRPRTC